MLSQYSSRRCVVLVCWKLAILEVLSLESKHCITFSTNMVFSQGSSFVRHLYIKEYSSSGEEHATTSKNCGLFVTGLPFLAHDMSEVLTDLFGAFGAVERVAVHPSQV